MPECMAQGLIDAPLGEVWSLASDASRQKDWWPDYEEFEVVDGGPLVEGCKVRQVTNRPWPLSDIATTVEVERLAPGKEVFIRCLGTGTCTRILLTEAQGSTFVEVTAGNDMENAKRTDRVLMTLAGKRLFRRWVDHAVERLRAVAETTAKAPVGIE